MQQFSIAFSLSWGIHERQIKKGDPDFLMYSKISRLFDVLSIHYLYRLTVEVSHQLTYVFGLWVEAGVSGEGRTCKHHTGRPQPAGGFEPRTLLL